MKNKYSESIAIILAGGKSSRAEMLKGLRTFNKQYWINYITERYILLGVKSVLIGLGYHADQYLDVLLHNTRLEVCVNKVPENGSYSTLYEVFNNLSEQEYRNVFIHPIDVPFPETHTLEKLLEPNAGVAKPSFQNMSGHPICISNNIVSTLLQNSISTSRLDYELKKIPEAEVKYVNVNDVFVTKNLNTAEEWNEFLKELDV